MTAGVRVVAASIAFVAASIAASGFDLQGHRGARGLMPENTLPGFAKALEIGVSTLETDLAVTRDGILVLSHDPVLNPEIVRGPDGAWLNPPTPRIHGLTLDEVQRYDVGRIKPGTRYTAQFNTQQPVDGARIPTLVQLFDLARSSGKKPRFNLETKLSPERPHETPDPETFIRLLVETVRAAGVSDHTTIQSFDWRTLIAARALAPDIATACLTAPGTVKDSMVEGRRQPSPWLAGLDPASFGNSPPRLAKAAGCSTWSPRFTELTRELVAEAHALGLNVVPWTINDPAEMARAVDMKVDGLITDYPDRARTVLGEMGIPLPH